MQITRPKNTIPTQYTLKSSAYKVLVYHQLRVLLQSLMSIHRFQYLSRPARQVKHNYEQTSSVTYKMQSLHWRRLDKWRIDSKHSIKYKITHNLIAIPISDFLIPLERPSAHYHSSSYRLITASTDYYKFSFFSRAVHHWNNRSPKTVACRTLEQFNQAVCKIEHVSPQENLLLLKF